MALLVGEQPLLALEAAAVADQGAGLADHPVAGDDDADRVAAVGEPDRAGRLRQADAQRERAVALGGAIGNVEQRRQTFCRKSVPSEERRELEVNSRSSPAK